MADESARRGEVLRQDAVAPSVTPADGEMPRYRLVVDPALFDPQSRILQRRSDFADGPNGETVRCERQLRRHVRITDPDHRVSDPTRQELRPDTTAEADVRRNACSRSLGHFDGAGDSPLTSPVESPRDDGTQDHPVWAAELPGHRGRQPLAPRSHGSSMTLTAPADARRWRPPS